MKFYSHVYIKRELLFKVGRFRHTIFLYEEAKEKAYISVYINDISVHKISKYKLNPEEVDKYQKIFIKTFKDLAGNNIWNDVEIIKGSSDNIINDLIYFFRDKIISLESNLDFDMETKSFNNNYIDDEELYKLSEKSKENKL